MQERRDGQLQAAQIAAEERAVAAAAQRAKEEQAARNKAHAAEVQAASARRVHELQAQTEAEQRYNVECQKVHAGSACFAGIRCSGLQHPYLCVAF